MDTIISTLMLMAMCSTEQQNNMDYKTKIIKMIENMQNEDFLMKIYYFVRVIFAKDAEGAYTLDKANLRKDG